MVARGAEFWHLTVTQDNGDGLCVKRGDGTVIVRTIKTEGGDKARESLSNWISRYYKRNGVCPISKIK